MPFYRRRVYRRRSNRRPIRNCQRRYRRPIRRERNNRMAVSHHRLQIIDHIQMPNTANTNQTYSRFSRFFWKPSKVARATPSQVPSFQAHGFKCVNRRAGPSLCSGPPGWNLRSA
ncbi:putative capsid protein [Anguilla anguilla circovirus]|nr:putative capsid protein [Anguilla anguilla circovirus]APZ87905.1 putative capsid protein [Anguilla anguilla circovirus]